MTRNSILIAALLLSAGLAFQSAAGASERQSAKTGTKPAAVASAALTEGEVLRVDRAAGTATIKHGPMPKLDMPAMAMPYKVKDKAVLDDLKPGDKIAFEADSVGGVFTVVRLEKRK
ncbi:MAG: copper-binding protein [Burkholderiales bacterium]|nr:copper-binding protein [Burkholderiales bacterium]